MHKAVNSGTCFHFKEGETKGERSAEAYPKALSWRENETITEIKSIKTETQQEEERDTETHREQKAQKFKTREKQRRSPKIGNAFSYVLRPCS